ncbi:MAG TPA: cytochrome P450 [Anaerolineales bacterium]|nr:cytochrome P450 [Anaerolineales bacterium]
MSDTTQAKRKYDLYSHESKANIYPIFRQMRVEDPWLTQIGFDGETLICFPSRYEDIEAILKDDRHFVRDPSNMPGSEPTQFNELDQLLSNHMLNKDWSDHRRLRDLVSKAFTPKLVREMRPRIQALADELIATLRDRGEMDLIADYAFPLPTTVIAEILGIPTKDRDKFKEWSAALITPTMDPEKQVHFQKLLEEFVEYLKNLFVIRRAEPQDDLLCALLNAEQDGDRLSEKELFSMMVLLIVAGHETTVNLIGNAMLALFHYPEQMAELKTNPTLMPQAVEEFLRYDGPVERAFVRFATEDVVVNGHEIKKGTLVIPLIGSANRDPAVFHNPDRLDFHRENNPHFAFGKGVHYCMGAPLARLEGEIALNNLLQSLPDLEMAIPADQLRYRMLPTFRSLESLPVCWKSDNS